jgi:hypothetical protein
MGADPPSLANTAGASRLIYSLLAWCRLLSSWDETEITAEPMIDEELHHMVIT